MIIQASDFPMDEQGHIASDLHCLGCGYNLRTLRRDDICPECALPVDRSTQKKRLCFADPAWVRSLAQGMKWISLSFLVSLLSACSQWLLRKFHATSFPTPASLHVRWYTPVIFSTVGAIFYFVGLWKFSRQDPQSPVHSGWDEARVMRVAAIAFGFLSVISLAISWTAAIRSTKNDSPTIDILLGVCLGISKIIAFGAMVSYAHIAAERAASQRLARLVEIVLLVITVFEIAFTLGRIVSFFQFQAASYNRTLSMMWLLLFFLWWATEACAFVILGRFASALRRAADEGRTARIIGTQP